VACILLCFASISDKSCGEKE